MNSAPDAAPIAQLAATVLDQEAERQGRHDAPAPPSEARHDVLPGVGVTRTSVRSALDTDGRSTLLATGALWFFALFEFATLAVLAPDLRHQFDLGHRFLANVVMAPALLFFVAQPIGNLVDRPTTSRPRVMGAMAGLGALAVGIAGISTNRWIFLVACAFAGVGLLASQPAQVALLADRAPLGARPEVFGIYTTIGVSSFVVAPLLVALVSAGSDGQDAWRVGFLVAAAAIAVVAILGTRLRDVRRGRNEIDAVFGDDRELVAEQPAFAHVVARFAQIDTLRLMTVGVVVLGFVLLGWGLSLNLFLAEHFGVTTTDRGLLLALIALPGAPAAWVVGRHAGDRFRGDPARVVRLGAVLLGVCTVSVVGLWMPNVALLAVCEAVAFTSACGLLATLPPVVLAVVPPQMRAQGGAAFMSSLFVGASAGAALVASLGETYGRRTVLSVGVPVAVVLGASLMAYAARFVTSDMARVVDELREERAVTDLHASGRPVPLLQIRGLDFSYGSVQVLFDVDLDIQRGETVALLGTNGAGKSTLLRIVSGLAIPSRGVIRLDGHAITYLDPTARVRRGIVQVSGGHAVFAPLSVGDNLQVAAFSCNPHTAEARIDRSLARFPALANRVSTPAGALSGGQQQMLALAKALVLEPELLVIDELSLGLAPQTVQELLAVIEDLKHQGVTMLIVEQSVNVGLSIADRAIFMEKGEIRFEGAADDLLERDDLLRAVFFGSEGG